MHKIPIRIGSKKGQAALEYLVTYGWALILIFGIIVLLYAYIFKPEFYVAESCDMAPGIECGTFTLVRSGNEMVLNLRLSNGMDFEIKPREINITAKDFLDAGEKTYTWQRDGTCYPIGSCTARAPLSVPSRGEMSISFSFPLEWREAPRPATLQRMKFSMSYEITETGSVHRTAGILNVKVS
ncbi:MAG: hypothetical protein QW112_03505 [Candidatus Micrarchaeia archaeon]